MSFENLWTFNGVVINENLRGQDLPLFIEDAIQETTTQVSGISAEYGRFSGGVINAITKSGGNELLRLVPHHLRERRLDRADAADRRSAPTRSTRPTRRPSAATCGRTTCGSSAPAATAS